MPRIVPLTGTEAERTATIASILTQEIHSTSDQKRVFLENKIVAPLWLGTVANEAAMLALTNRKTATTISADSSDNSFNDSATGFPVWSPGDIITVYGFDTPANNKTTFTIVSRTAGKIVVSGGVLVSEASGDTVTLTKNGTFGCWPGDLCYRSDTATAWRCIADNGEDLADWFELPKGASYAQGAAVANVDQTGFPANGAIAALTFSAVPTQAECQALRDECEKLRDTLAAAISTIDTLKSRFKVTGGNGLIAD